MSVAAFAVASLGCSASEETSKATVTGTVTYLQSITLPADAEVHVRLEDISLQDAPAGLIAEKSFNVRGKESPIPFAIEYDPGLIEESHAYSIRAEILVGGERKFMSTQSYPVLTREAPAHADVIVMALAAEAPTHTALVGTHWALVEIGGQAVTKAPIGREPYLVLLEEEQRAVATGGCNQMSGTYRLASDETGTKLSFSQFAATLKACPDGFDHDAALSTVLQSTAACRVDGSRMELMNASGAVLARFQAATIEEE
jgi:uncharacterized lipoprotein YbaY